MNIAYIDGDLIKVPKLPQPLAERGFLYGDGLFETIKIEAGRAQYLGRHLARLYSSAVELGILSPDGQAAFIEPIQTLIKDATDLFDEETGRLRAVLTTGRPGRGPRWIEKQRPRLYLSIEPYASTTEFDAEGVSAITASFRRFSGSPLVRHKSLSFQENVLALREAKKAAVFEAIFRNQDGVYSEGATTNLFIYAGDQLVTPPRSDGLLPGVIRARAIELSKSLELAVSESSVTPELLSGASEAFLTNSIVGALALTQLDAKPIGDGKPGPICKKIAETLANDAERMD